MKEIKESVLVLLDGDTQLIHLIAKIIGLGSSGAVPDVFEILQRPTDLSAMRFNLGTNVI